MLSHPTDRTQRTTGEALRLNLSGCDRMGRGMKPLLQATAFLALALCGTCAASAAPLKDSSPFLPPDHNTSAPKVVKPVQQNGPLSREIEFRGVIQMGGAYQFSLFSKKDQRGYWIGENESQNGLSVRNFDANSTTVTISLSGRTERLTLMTSNDSPLPVATAAPKSPTFPVKPTLPPGLGGQSGNSGDDARRVIPRRRVILPRN